MERFLTAFVGHWLILGVLCFGFLNIARSFAVIPLLFALFASIFILVFLLLVHIGNEVPGILDGDFQYHAYSFEI